MFKFAKQGNPKFYIDRLVKDEKDNKDTILAVL